MTYREFLNESTEGIKELRDCIYYIDSNISPLLGLTFISPKTLKVLKSIKEVTSELKTNILKKNLVKMFDRIKDIKVEYKDHLTSLSSLDDVKEAIKNTINDNKITPSYPSRYVSYSHGQSLRKEYEKARNEYDNYKLKASNPYSEMNLGYRYEDIIRNLKKIIKALDTFQIDEE